jgi:hypothetical protein
MIAPLEFCFLIVLVMLLGGGVVMLSGYLAVVIFAQRRAICVVSDIRKRVGFFHEKSTMGCGREIQKTSGYACR